MQGDLQLNGKNKEDLLGMEEILIMIGMVLFLIKINLIPLIQNKDSFSQLINIQPDLNIHITLVKHFGVPLEQKELEMY